MVKLVYEFIGTFFLVFTVGMTVLNPDIAEILAPLAIGSVLAVMAFAGGHISGGHYNPAVSLAIFLKGKLGFVELVLYWVAQLIAALVASLLVMYYQMVPDEPMEFMILPALIAEFLFTFALCFVILNVTQTNQNADGKYYFGFAIGFTVLAGAYAVGNISGGAFNPAVALGITLLGINLWSNFWVYIVANLIGGAAAALVFKYAHPNE